MPIHEGDVVKSSKLDIKMTVGKIEGKEYICQWFDSNIELQTERFPESDLFPIIEQHLSVLVQ